MAAYDPKRPRPGASDGDEPAPVEALLEAVDSVGERASEASGELEAAGPPEAQDADGPDRSEPDEVDEVDLRATPPPEVSSNGSAAPRSAPEVPIAPPPEEGTANRAVLIAGLVSSALVVLVIAVLRRRAKRG